MATKISFINFKGGVAKTTLAVNFAATLARRGHKTLLVDLDPQSNASLWLLGPDRFLARLEEPIKTVYQLFLDRIPHVTGGHLNFRFNDAVVKAVAQDKRGYAVTPHLDLLPNTFKAVELEHHLSASNAPTYDILKKGLEDVQTAYDYIVFDCAPNLYLTTINALLFSDYYIIPVYPDYFARAGLTILTKEIKKNLDKFKGYVGEAPKLLGIVITRIKTGATLDVGRKIDLETSLKDLIRDDVVSPHAIVFKTYFNDTVEVSRSIEKFIPSIFHKPYYPPMTSYIERMNKFVDEFLDTV